MVMHSSSYEGGLIYDLTQRHVGIQSGELDATTPHELRLATGICRVIESDWVFQTRPVSLVWQDMLS